MFPLLLLLVFCENITQCKYISSVNITFVAFMIYISMFGHYDYMLLCLEDRRSCWILPIKHI